MHAIIAVQVKLWLLWHEKDQQNGNWNREHRHMKSLNWQGKEEKLGNGYIKKNKKIDKFLGVSKILD